MFMPMNSKENWANEETTDQTRTLTCENERTKNRVNELAKQDEQLNDRVESSFVCILKCLKGSIDFLIF